MRRNSQYPCYTPDKAVKILMERLLASSYYERLKMVRFLAHPVAKDSAVTWKVRSGLLLVLPQAFEPCASFCPSQ